MVKESWGDRARGSKGWQAATDETPCLNIQSCHSLLEGGGGSTSTPLIKSDAGRTKGPRSSVLSFVMNILRPSESGIPARYNPVIAKSKIPPHNDRKVVVSPTIPPTIPYWDVYVSNQQIEFHALRGKKSQSIGLATETDWMQAWDIISRIISGHPRGWPILVIRWPCLSKFWWQKENAKLVSKKRSLTSPPENIISKCCFQI